MTRIKHGDKINLRKRKLKGGEQMFDKRRFMAQLALSGVTLRELAAKLGINETTLYRKLNDDGRFSRKEINEIIDFLRIDDPTPIFFAS